MAEPVRFRDPAPLTSRRSRVATGGNFRGELLVAGALALVLRLIYLSGATHNPLFTHLELDPRLNDTLGWGIARGLNPEPGPFFRAPLYGYFLAGAYSIFGHNLFYPRLLQALMGTGTAILLGATASRLWGRRAGTFAAVVAALYGPLIYFEGELVSVSLEVFLTAASIYFTVCAGWDRSRRPLVLAGLALSASAVARPTVLPFALVAIAWLLSRRLPPRRVAAYAVAVAFLPLLVTSWNGLVGKDWVSAASQGGIERPARIASQAAAPFARRLALTWNRRELPGDQDQQFFAPFNSWLFRRPWLLGFWFLAPIAFVTAYTERRTAALLGGYLVCATLVAAAFFVCDRFRLPLVVAMIPLAGAGIDRFATAFGKAAMRGRGWPAATLANVACSHGRTLVAIGLATVFVTAPFPSLQRTESGTSWFRLARAHEAAGELNLAGAAYQAAELEGMRSADFYNNWGLFEMKRRLGIHAQQHLLKAVMLDPKHGPAHENLAELYTDRDEWGLAAQEYAAAAELIPERAAELYTNAGALYARIDREDTAVEMYEKALANRPGFTPAEERLMQLRAGTWGEAEMPKPKTWSLTPP